MTAAAIFQFEEGTHYGKINYTDYTLDGNSAQFPVVFESESGNPVNTIIAWDAVTSAGGVIFRAPYMKLRNLTLSYLHNQNSGIVGLGNSNGNANNSAYEIENNIISGDSVRAISISNANILIRNNTMSIKKYDAVTLTDSKNIVIDGNTIKGMSGFGLWIMNGNNVHIKNNKISFSLGASSLAMGIALSGGTGTLLVERNLIQQGKNRGIQYTGSLVTQTTLEISNNMVGMYFPSTYVGGTIQAGISIIDPRIPVKIYHNTISNMQPVSSGYNSTALYVDYTTAAGSIDIKNNIFTGVGILLDLNDYQPSFNVTLDYNDYFKTTSSGPGNYPIYINDSAYASLSAFRQNTVFEDNGKSVNPMLVQTTFNNTNTNIDLHMSQAQLINAGNTTLGIMYDYDGHARYQPDIGAHEVNVADVEISQLTGIHASSCGGSYDFSNDSILTVQLQNNGTGTFPVGFNIVLTCSINGVVQVVDTIILSTDWLQGQTISHTLTQPVSLLSNGANDIVISMGNYDFNSANDSIHQLVGNFQPPNPGFNVSSYCQDNVVFQNTSTTQAGTLSYQWSFGDGTSTATSPSHSFTNFGIQDVTLTALSSTGCSDSITQQVNVLEAPDVILAAFSAVCVYTSAFTLSGGQPSGGTYSGVGITNNIFNPQTAGLGNHQIGYSYVNPDGCGDTVYKSMLVSACTGIKELLQTNIIIYPNPTSGFFTIELPTATGIYQLQDLTGKQLLSGTITATKFGLDISALSKGIYLLSVFDGEQVAHKKIVKE